MDYFPWFIDLSLAGMALWAGIGLFLSRGKARLRWFTPAMLGVATYLTAIAPGVFPSLFDPRRAGCTGSIPKSWFYCQGDYRFQVYLAYLQFYVLLTLIACAAVVGWIGLTLGVWHLLTRTYNGESKEDRHHPDPQE